MLWRAYVRGRIMKVRAGITIKTQNFTESIRVSSQVATKPTKAENNDVFLNVFISIFNNLGYQIIFLSWSLSSGPPSLFSSCLSKHVLLTCLRCGSSSLSPSCQTLTCWRLTQLLLSAWRKRTNDRVRSCTASSFLIFESSFWHNLDWEWIRTASCSVVYSGKEKRRGEGKILWGNGVTKNTEKKKIN